MNNLVFNNTASELMMTVGNPSLTVDGSVTISNTSLTVAGNVTVSNSITIANTSLTVAGTVTVSEITNPVTIGNSSLTVAGSVTITNATLTTFNSGNAFTSLTVTSTTVTGTGVVFADTDISQQKTASIFVYNESAQPFFVSLQISPTTTDGDYLDDPNYTSYTVDATSGAYIPVSRYAHYARLQYIGATAQAFHAYYNAQA